MKKLTLFFVSLVVFIHVAPRNALASSPISQPIAQLQQIETNRTLSPVASPSTCESCTTQLNDVFLERTLKHEELVDQDIQRFFNVVTQVLDLGKWLIGGGILAAIIAFITVLYRASKAAEKAAAAEVDKKLKLIDLSPYIDKSTNTIINTRLGLNKEIAILSLGKTTFEKANNARAYLQQAGFENTRMARTVKSAMEADVIVYVHHDSQEEFLTEMLSNLTKEKSSLPVIIYSRRFSKALGDTTYEFATAANSLLTLASWTLTVSSTTKSVKGQNGK